MILIQRILTFKLQGELAQLARALRLHRRGHRFDSDILHKVMRFNRILTRKFNVLLTNQ